MSAAPDERLRKNVTTDHQESNPIMAAKKPPVKAAPSKTSKAPVTRPAAQQAAAKAASPNMSKTPAVKSPATGSKAAPAKGGALKAPAAALPKAAPVVTVTLKHLATEIAEQQQIEKQQADAILNGLVGLLVQHLKSGDRLRIGGLGILEVKNRPERAGRNPATGEPMTIKASKKVTFRPAKEMKEAV